MEQQKVSAYEGAVQVAWDNSSLALLRTCPRKYYLSNILGLTPKGGNVHLDFGLRYHHALEEFDHLRASGASYADAQHETIKRLLRTSVGFQYEHKTKTRKTLVRAVCGYLDHFKTDPANTIILANGKPAVELSFHFEIDVKSPFGYPYLLCGHLDRIVEYQEKIWVMDRKTTTRAFAWDFIKSFKPSGQMQQYTWGSKVVFHPEVQGCVIDAVYIAANLDEYSRFPATYSNGQLEEWYKNTIYYIKAAERYHDADYWPQNFEACHLYAGCQFREICGRDPSVRKMVISSEFVRDRWDPLVTREKVE